MPVPLDIKRGIQAPKSSLEKALINQRRQFKIIKTSNDKGISFLSNFILYVKF